MSARTTWPIRHQIRGTASPFPSGKVRAQHGIAETTRRAGRDQPRTSGSPVARRSPPSANLLLTISELASLLGVHRSTLYRTIGRSDAQTCRCR
jgi:hypothetical protein